MFICLSLSHIEIRDQSFRIRVKPIQIGIDAMLVIGGKIFKVVGKTQRSGELIYKTAELPRHPETHATLVCDQRS
jgi:hypothetical protein